MSYTNYLGKISLTLVSLILRMKLTLQQHKVAIIALLCLQTAWPAAICTNMTELTDEAPIGRAAAVAQIKSTSNCAEW